MTNGRGAMAKSRPDFICVNLQTLGHENSTSLFLLKAWQAILVVIVELVEKNDLVWSTNLDENGILHGGNAMGKILTICRRHLLVGGVPNINPDLLNASKIHVLGRRIYF